MAVVLNTPFTPVENDVLSWSGSLDFAIPFSSLNPGTYTTSFLHSSGVAVVVAPEYTVTVVPEPSSSALIGLGALGFLVRRRR